MAIDVCRIRGTNYSEQGKQTAFQKISAAEPQKSDDQKGIGAKENQQCRQQIMGLLPLHHYKGRYRDERPEMQVIDQLALEPQHRECRVGGKGGGWYRKIHSILLLSESYPPASGAGTVLKSSMAVHLMKQTAPFMTTISFVQLAAPCPLR